MEVIKESVRACTVATDEISDRKRWNRITDPICVG